MFKSDNFRKSMLMFAFVTMLAAVPVFGANFDDDKSNSSGCGDNVIGTYTRSTRRPDVLGDGSNIDHTYLGTLILNDDGTAYQYSTGRLDFLMYQGTITPSAGSWKCRSDGKVVVTIIRANYDPVIVRDPISGDTFRDLILVRHDRITRLFRIVDNNNIRLIRRAVRFYSPTQDPGDPTGGSLQPTVVRNDTFTRLIASDADLTS